MSHSLYVDGEWHRCRDCPGFAHTSNKDYWIGKECKRYAKRARRTVMERWQREAQEHQIATDSDTDCDPDEDEQAEDKPELSSKINNEPAQAGSTEYYNLLAEMVEMHYDNIPVTWEDGLSLKKAEKMLRERTTKDTDTSINEDQQQLHQQTRGKSSARFRDNFVSLTGKVVRGFVAISDSV